MPPGHSASERSVAMYALDAPTLLMKIRSCASGWLGFYWGQTPQQLKASKQPGDALMLSWLDLFTKMRTKIAAVN